jgi:flavin reductase (DIM6/NTAB) family NADH-FMN oxidoreductase RutF
MNVNCLTEDTPFAVFQHFGFQSGRNVDKFNGATPDRSENGVAILPAFSNAFLSLDVEQYVDLDTHGMFICTVSEAQVLSDAPSVTYAYYHAHIKPQPPKKKGYVCKICGYVYEGEPLPPDFICPLCKHPASDFEKMQ